MKHKSKIAAYRDMHDLSLEALGEMFNPPVNKSTVMRWERGHITAQRAIEIERVTGISRGALLPEIFEVSA